MKDKVVLYVDDDHDDITILQGIFDEVEDSPELLCLNDSEQVMGNIAAIRHSGKELCLVLLDINMPRLDGRSVAQAIRELDGLRSTPIAFITTSSSPADKLFAANLGVALFTKANSLEGMKNLAHEIIRHCAMVKSN